MLRVRIRLELNSRKTSETVMEPLEDSFILNGRQQKSIMKVTNISSFQLSWLWAICGAIKSSPCLGNTIAMHQVIDYVSISNRVQIINT